MELKRVIIAGHGAVSPAGWGIDVLRNAVQGNIPLKSGAIPGPGSAPEIPVYGVPNSSPRPAYMAHARLRRASPIAQYAVGAGLEALGLEASNISTKQLKLGIVHCVNSGCVNYSKRFYAETLRDASTASPLVFPETVFNAPASHIAALLGTTEINYTLVGDAGTFLVGLSIAAQWLMGGKVNGCLVIGAEEIDWLTASALKLFDRRTIFGAGAGALFLKLGGRDETQPSLSAITDPQLFLNGRTRNEAIRAMRTGLPNPEKNACLFDSVDPLSKHSRAELEAWHDWTSSRVSPKAFLGEGLCASAAWQCVLAADSLGRGDCEQAYVSVVGLNQQAVGAVFLK